MKRSYHAIDVNFTRESLGIYFFPLFLFFLSIDVIHSSKFQCVTNLSIKKKSESHRDFVLLSTFYETNVSET